jgi:hypothetical protein
MLLKRIGEPVRGRGVGRWRLCSARLHGTAALATRWLLDAAVDAWVLLYCLSLSGNPAAAARRRGGCCWTPARLKHAARSEQATGHRTNSEERKKGPPSQTLPCLVLACPTLPCLALPYGPYPAQWGHHTATTTTTPARQLRENVGTYLHTFIHTYIHTYIHTCPMQPCSTAPRDGVGQH